MGEFSLGRFRAPNADRHSVRLSLTVVVVMKNKAITSLSLP